MILQALAAASIVGTIKKTEADLASLSRFANLVAGNSTGSDSISRRVLVTGGDKASHLSSPPSAHQSQRSDGNC